MLIRGVGVVLCGLLILGSAAPAAAQDRGLAVLEEAAARYSNVQTICARFTQHLQVPLLGNERTGTGRLCQARPNLFAMRFDDPEGDVVVVDGEFAWVFLPSNDPRTVLRTSAEESAGGRDFHREFLEDPETKYEVTYEATEVVDGHETHRLRMIPSGPANYDAAVIWIDEGMPVLRRLRLEEENGSVRTITLAEVGFDVDAGEGWFTFTPPPGAIVIER